MSNTGSTWLTIVALALAVCAGCQPPPAGLQAPSSLAAQEHSPNSPQRPIQYHFEIDPNLGKARVKASFLDPPDPLELLGPGSISTVLPSFLEGLRAECGASDLFMEVVGDGRLHIHHANCPEVLVSWRVALPVSPSSMQVVIAGHSSLLVPAQSGAISVEIAAPRRWSVATNWRSEGAAPTRGERLVRWRFVAEDSGHLHDSVVVAGELRQRALALKDGRALKVAIGGELPVSDDALVDMIARLTEAQQRFLPEGWTWPAGTAQLSIVVLGQPGRGAGTGAGRRGGAVVQIGTQSTPQALAELLAHEIFHVLNGHLLVHRPEEEFSTLWFKEGVTTYVALLSVVWAKLADDHWMRQRLAALAEGYYENPMSSRLPASRLGARHWNDPSARRLPYDKGALLGFILDVRLRRGGSHLGDWFGHLLSTVAAQGRAYSDADLRGAARTLGLSDVDTLWSRFVQGVEPLPLSDALATLGLGLERSVEPTPYYGWSLVPMGGAQAVVSIEPQSPATRAGLRLGDRILRRAPVVSGTGVSLRVQRGQTVLHIRLTPESGHHTVYRINHLPR